MPPISRRSFLRFGLASGLLLGGCGQQGGSQQGANQGTAIAPTARIVQTKEPSIVIPTLTPTLPPSPTAVASEITRPPFISQGRTGPGGLPFPLQLTKLNFGVVGHLYYTDRYTALNAAQDVGFQWFRQQIHWRDIEDQSGQFFWADLDNIVADLSARGILLMLSVVRSPAWYTANGSYGLPQDPASLARFVAALAQHYKGRVHAIEVWNEQNLAHENGGHVSLDDAGHYVEILKACYESIKAVDPSIIVVAGGPSSSATNDPGIAVPDQDYLRAMYSYNNGMIEQYFDVQAIHPGGSANSPTTLWPDAPSTANGWTDHETFYFRHVENGRKIMEEYGMGEHQIWITEFGWATHNSSPGFEFGDQISFETQRDYIVGAIQQSYQYYPWLSNMFLWNLNFTILQREHGGDPLHEQGSFSIVNADGSPRPAYYGVKEKIAEIKQLQNS